MALAGGGPPRSDSVAEKNTANLPQPESAKEGAPPKRIDADRRPTGVRGAWAQPGVDGPHAEAALRGRDRPPHRGQDPADLCAEGLTSFIQAGGGG